MAMATRRKSPNVEPRDSRLTGVSSSATFKPGEIVATTMAERFGSFCTANASARKPTAAPAAVSKITTKKRRFHTAQSLTKMRASFVVRRALMIESRRFDEEKLHAQTLLQCHCGHFIRRDGSRALFRSAGTGLVQGANKGHQGVRQHLHARRRRRKYCRLRRRRRDRDRRRPVRAAGRQDPNRAEGPGYLRQARAFRHQHALSR